MQKYLRYGYLILISTVLPLFMRQGYFELGEAKGLCYMVLSGVFALLFLIFDGKRLFERGRLTGSLCICLLAFFFSNLLSFVFSVDKKAAFLGLDGWRSGFLTICLMLFFFLVFYEKEYVPDSYVMAAVMITPFLESVLAVLNRIGIYPFEIYGQNPGFVATIGNINWFTAYLSVFVPLGAGISCSRKLFSKEFFLSALYMEVTLTALLMQGSDSGLIVILAVYGVLLFASLATRQEFRMFLVQLFVLGLSMETGWLLITIFRESYNYQDNLLKSICTSHAGAIIMALVLLIYRSSRLFEEIRLPWRAGIYRILAGTAALAACAAAGFIFIPGLDYSSGNGRILIYSICLDMYREMDPVRKIFGAGQDCLYSYAYQDPVISESLYNVFGFNTLTNAHCDLLTILIERGILGVLTYMALLISFAAGIFKHKNKHAALVCALILVSYFLNSLVSFSLVVSAPFFFLAMAVGLSMEKN